MVPCLYKIELWSLASLWNYLIYWSYLSSPAGGKHSDGARGGFNPVAELEKLRRAQQSRCHLEIGELLRVRGPVKTSRQQREIMASTFCECRGAFIIHFYQRATFYKWNTSDDDDCSLETTNAPPRTHFSPHSPSPTHAWQKHCLYPSTVLWWPRCVSLWHTNIHNNTQHIFLFESTCHLYPLPIHHVCVCRGLCVFPDKVNDPVMAVQIAWMMEVPQLYRLCYDKPFQLQLNDTGYKPPSLNAPSQRVTRLQWGCYPVFSANFNWISKKSAKEGANEGISIHHCCENMICWFQWC